MTPPTAEWVAKAEGDYGTVLVLLRSRRPDRHDAICFHAQQCVDKDPKGRLVEAGVSFSKTHDLANLLTSVIPLEPLWAVFAGRMKGLSGWAVAQRYPGVTATPAQSRTAVRTCRAIREVARASLGL